MSCVKFLLVAALAASLAGCSADKRSRSEHRQEEQLAIDYGRRQALHLSTDSIGDSAADTIEMERVLIDVRVRETTLRNRGEHRLADLYIDSFLSTLDSVNPSLRGSLN